MTAAEYDAWVPGAIEAYAADHVRVGSKPADTALETATKEFETLLPDGVDTAEHHLLVVMADDDRVGILWLNIADNIAGPGAFVYDVEVDAAKRGKGYGRGIMLAAEDYARDRGATSIKLHVFGDNTVARRLYDSLGYSATNVIMAKPLA
jgi:ribosomal protein S18 acetylase RimI-like enzyme